MNNVKKMVYLSLFIALEVVLTRFLSIQTPIIRIGFGFLPVAISAMMFGPLPAGIAAALADIIGMMLFPSGGAYFPGFTLTAFLTGAIFGVFLFNKPKSLLRISVAVIIISLFVNLGLDTLWLKMITGKGYLALMPVRITKCIAIIPIEIPMIKLVWRYVVSQLKYNNLTGETKHRVV